MLAAAALGAGLAVAVAGAVDLEGGVAVGVRVGGPGAGGGQADRAEELPEVGVGVVEIGEAVCAGRGAGKGWRGGLGVGWEREVGGEEQEGNERGSGPGVGWWSCEGELEKEEGEEEKAWGWGSHFNVVGMD